MKKQLKKKFSTEYETRYKQYRNYLNNIIRITKNDYYKNKINSVKNNGKKTSNNQ